MCEQMSVVVASCIERFVAMRTLFLVDLALLALVLGELVTSQNAPTCKIFLALIALVSFLFMNILNVRLQIALLCKLFFITNKSHLFFCFSLVLRARTDLFFGCVFYLQNYSNVKVK